MKKKTEETIFALSTPYGQSAIAVVVLVIQVGINKYHLKTICHSSSDLGDPSQHKINYNIRGLGDPSQHK